MEAPATLSLFRTLRANGHALKFAEAPLAEIPVPRVGFVGLFIVSLIVTASFDYLRRSLHLSIPEPIAVILATLLIISITCFPLMIFLYYSLKARRLLTEIYFTFPKKAQYWYAVAMVWFCCAFVVVWIPKEYDKAGNPLYGLLLPFVGAFGVRRWLRSVHEKPRAVPQLPPAEPARFGCYLGTSTGILAKYGHGAAMASGQSVVLDLADAAQNILVLGGIGSGKTTRAVQPLLVQLLDQDAGGLIFDIKGDFKIAVESIAHQAQRAVTIIGPEKTRMNVIAGLSPEVAASFLKSALLLNSRGTVDAFWLDTATELCKNALGVLSFFPQRYSLSALYTYLFDHGVQKGLRQEAEEKLLKLPEREHRLLKTYLAYHETIFAAFDDKVKSGVNASVAQILSPFQHPDLVDAFCTDDPAAPNMERVLDGAVFCVDLPLARWGLGGRVAYTLLKLRFFNALQRRNTEPSWNQERPVFFLCDEFQEIVSANRDGLSDLNFWDKSRSSKCIGIISAQAVSSFYAAIGSRDLADALLQNFRQKLCFKTEDVHTIELLNHLLGRVEVEKASYQQGEGTSSGILFTDHYSRSRHESVSRTTVEKQVINPQLFRTLGQNQAIALLSFAGVSADDVVECTPVFVE
ncbi:MAG: type IV secretory system conjugative DNA transfer family protein [Deltaproteobacteria bacterium]|nr:type IV secretory system conjugative DNA transfer family protein [Deltaproteobacteria bacterium]